MRGVNIMLQQEKDMEAIKEEIKKCNDELSMCDKQTSVLLHDIETRNFNACEGYMLCKELQDIREARRCWKDRRYELQDAYYELGGDAKLKQLKQKRKKRINRYIKGNSWKDNFSPEALAILQG